jgi:hypothetical protein
VPPRRPPPAHPPAGATHSQSPRVRWPAALCAECGVVRCSELCARCLLLLPGLITVLVPTIAGIWAYNEGYLTPQ